MGTGGAAGQAGEAVTPRMASPVPSVLTREIYLFFLSPSVRNTSLESVCRG